MSADAPGSSGHDPRLSPYARALGIAVHGRHRDAPLLALPFASQIEGRPGVLHGGAIAGLLEAAGLALLHDTLVRQNRGAARLKPINITTQFLAAGTAQTSFAAARLVRLGRRTANIAAEAWQDDPARPIATAVLNVLVAPPRD